MAELIKQRGKEELLQEEMEQQAVKSQRDYWQGYSDAIEYVIKLLLKDDEHNTTRGEGADNC